jgi:hypothetical protein
LNHSVAGERVFVQNFRELFQETMQPEVDLGKKKCLKLLQLLATDSQGFVVWNNL